MILQGADRVRRAEPVLRVVCGVVGPLRIIEVSAAPGASRDGVVDVLGEHGVEF